MYGMQPYPLASAAAHVNPLAYVRRVYALFTGGIAFVVAGALVALYAGTPAVLSNGFDFFEVPPVVAWGIQHPFLGFGAFIGAFFAASAMRRRPGVNVAALFGFTFLAGLFIAPSLFYAQLAAARGATLSAAPVRDAFLLTGAAFTGLTTYAFVTKRDFSFLGAALSTGLWVVLGASLLGFFFQSDALQLAIASVGVLLFAGYILFDTSRILRDASEDDAVGAALRLFLDVLNMFLFLLRILTGARRD